MTSPFSSSEQTELSRAVLDEVLTAVPDAILIGGWSTWVRTGGPTSHDIDLILDRASSPSWRDWSTTCRSPTTSPARSGAPPGGRSTWTSTSSTSPAWAPTCSCAPNGSPPTRSATAPTGS